MKGVAAAAGPSDDDVSAAVPSVCDASSPPVGSEPEAAGPGVLPASSEARAFVATDRSGAAVPWTSH